MIEDGCRPFLQPTTSCNGHHHNAVRERKRNGKGSTVDPPESEALLRSSRPIKWVQPRTTILRDRSSAVSSAVVSPIIRRTTRFFRISWRRCCCLIPLILFINLCLLRLQLLPDGGLATQQTEQQLGLAIPYSPKRSLQQVPPRIPPENVNQKKSHDNNNNKEEKRPRHLMIIASVPRDVPHLMSLWSQLECLGRNDSSSIDHEVIVSSQEWSRDTILEPVIQQARETLHRAIATHYIPTPTMKTDRHDVGLWCGALLNYTEKVQSATYITLINDSVFAIRSHNQSLETISKIQQQASPNMYDFVSLTYYQNGLQPPEFEPAWLESILRTFTPEGIQTFQRLICQGDFRCRRIVGHKKFHRCMVDNYEMGITGAMNTTVDRVIGVYPAVPPYQPTTTSKEEERPRRRLRRHHHHHHHQRRTKASQIRQPRTIPGWSSGNTQWWQKLVSAYDFPLQKVVFNTTRGRKITVTPPAQCTKHWNATWMAMNLIIDPPARPCRERPESLCVIPTKEDRLYQVEKNHQNLLDSKNYTLLSTAGWNLTDKEDNVYPADDETAVAAAMVNGKLHAVAALLLLPSNSTDNNINNNTRCHCVHCTADPVCDGLWRSTVVGGRGDPTRFRRIRLVISHCLHDLNWITDFLQGYKYYSNDDDDAAAADETSLISGHSSTDNVTLIRDVTIVSKCDKEVIGAPKGSNVIRLPNVGRCDHSYAFYLSQLQPLAPATNNSSSSITTNDDKHDDDNTDHEIVVFLKDDRDWKSIHQPGTYRNLTEMLRIASETGFACGLQPATVWKMRKQKADNETHFRRELKLLSSYHVTSSLQRFTLKRYASRGKKYNELEESSNATAAIAPANGGASNGTTTSTITSFRSNYKNLGDWIRQSIPDAILPSPPSTTLTEVCYGGTFAASRSNIVNRQSSLVWKQLEQSLSRGNNIEEGHFAERSWAALLANPLNEYQTAALLDYGTELITTQGSIMGALAIIAPALRPVSNEKNVKHSQS
jgi:hypothetical protein